MQRKLIISYLLKGIIILLFFPACNTVQFLKNDETYLTKNTIEFDKKQEGKIKNKSKLAYELSTLPYQKPNEKFFGVPRQYFHYKSMDTLGRMKIGKSFHRFIRNRLGEKPSLYDEKLAQSSTEKLKRYLMDQGYIHADVSFYTKYKRKQQKVEVIYFVEPNGQYLIDTLHYECEDDTLLSILEGIRPESFFQKGATFDKNNLFNEQKRITDTLRNRGYYYFSGGYFNRFSASDTSNFEVTAKMEVLLPKGDSIHRQYKIGDIIIYQQSKFASNELPPVDTTINGIHFARGGKDFRVKPKVLLDAIAFKKGDYYRKDDENSTLFKLNSLGVFSFVTINPRKNPFDENELDFEIFLTPNKKWEFGFDWEMNFSARQNIGEETNLIGLSMNPSLTGRNFRRGAEQLVTNIDFGIELDPLASTNIINTLDFKVQADWNFPRFVDYAGFWKNFNKLGLVSSPYYQNLKDKAISKISLSYDWQVLLDRYQLYLFNASFGYTLNRSSRSRFEVNNFGVDVLIPLTQPSFEALLQQNPFLESSFTPQLLTGFILRDINYSYTGPENEKGHYWQFFGSIDVSGLEILGINKLYNAIGNNDTKFRLFGAEFSQYARLDLDLRRKLRIDQRRSFVFRFNTGVAVPFGLSNTVPYVKQFFVGGPQSLRGWSARAVGPGSYQDPLALDPNRRNLFYQTADLKMEFNFEYRFPLIKVVYPIYGAAFIDVGNIWSLGFIDETERPGATLSLRRERNADYPVITNDLFLREFAISGGMGIRWDFSYFIFRLDLGTPIKNNRPDPNRNDSYWADFQNWTFKNVVWNIGLGYPF